VAQCPHGGRHLGRAVADRDSDDGSAEPGGVVDLDDADCGGDRGRGHFGEYGDAETGGDKAEASGPFADGVVDPRVASKSLANSNTTSGKAVAEFHR